MCWKTLLPEESRKIVDECLDRILPKNWQGCGDIVESVVAAAKIHSLPEETVSDAGRDEITRFVTGAVTAAIGLFPNAACLFRMLAFPKYQRFQAPPYISLCLLGHAAVAPARHPTFR